MKKKVWVLLLSMLLLLLAGQAGALEVSAEESVGEDVTDIGEEPRVGWHREKNYYQYYSTSGKMYTGWKTIKGNRYYFRKKAAGKAPKGSRLTGLCKIGSKTYYFSSKGVLQTGWQKINNKTYYFTETGKAGTIGTMYVGFKKVGKYRFLFLEDGTAAVGWTKYKGKTYFGSTGKTLGLRGRLMTGWKNISSRDYYFNSSGVLMKNRWISGKYYVDEKGRMLKDTVTPDGYIVNEKGEKGKKAKGWVKLGTKTYYYVSGKKTVGWKKISGKKYYFDKNGVRCNGWLKEGGAKYYLANGVMQTGWCTVKGKKYYFGTNGKMVTNTVIDGITIGADGVAADDGSSTNEKKPKVLLISGHGQGDSGAVGIYGSKTYYEYQCTREFANLIKQKMDAIGNNTVDVVMYDQNYDCYKVMSNWIIHKKKLGPLPKLNDYDYILEIHFNATVEASKDPSGDGMFKGVGMYVNSAKANTKLDQQIVKAIGHTGFRIWGGATGIFRSSGLFNAKTCQSKGVSYGLLETAFIDDKDDITFYNKNKEMMAEAVASAIVDYYSEQ